MNERTNPARVVRSGGERPLSGGDRRVERVAVGDGLRRAERAGLKERAAGRRCPDREVRDRFGSGVPSRPRHRRSRHRPRRRRRERQRLPIRLRARVGRTSRPRVTGVNLKKRVDPAVRRIPKHVQNCVRVRRTLPNGHRSTPFSSAGSSASSSRGPGMTSHSPVNTIDPNTPRSGAASSATAAPPTVVAPRAKIRQDP